MSDRLPPLTRIPPEIVAVTDYEPYACARVEPSAWDYLTGGGADEITLRANRAGYDRLSLNPRMLTDFSPAGRDRGDAPRPHLRSSDPSSRRSRTSSWPIPTASWRRCWSSGGGQGRDDRQHELQRPARGPRPRRVDAAVVSASTGRPHRGLTRNWCSGPRRRVHGAIVLTIDAPVGGVRNREQRAQLQLPLGVTAANLPGAAPMGARARAGIPLRRHPRGGAHLEGRRVAAVPHEAAPSSSRAPRARRGRGPRGRPGIRRHRRLEPRRCWTSMTLLGHDRRRCRGSPTARPRAGAVLMDGGIRRGTDVLKALALGASAVLVWPAARPTAWPRRARSAWRTCSLFFAASWRWRWR